MITNFNWSLLTSLNLFDVIPTCIVAILILVFMFVHIHKVFVIVSYLLMFIVYLVGLFLKLDALSSIAQLAIIIFSVACIMINISEFRNLLSNFSSAVLRRNAKSTEKKFDKKELYSSIENAVKSFSRTKTGALMVFQKSQPLNDGVNDNGIMVNAPLTAEMLETIFYKGTRLHDGAVIIKNDKIVSAAVMLVATQRPLSGKYGTRHRAAIGISERSDAVVVCVSEETGRVSLAYKGKLESVFIDRFLEEFTSLMDKE